MLYSMTTNKLTLPNHKLFTMIIVLYNLANLTNIIESIGTDVHSETLI